jgi:hypothetical protein
MISHEYQESAFAKDRVFFGIDMDQYSVDTTTKIGYKQYVCGSDFPHYDGQHLKNMFPELRQVLDENAKRFLRWT